MGHFSVDSTFPCWIDPFTERAVGIQVQPSDCVFWKWRYASVCVVLALLVCAFANIAYELKRRKVPREDSGSFEYLMAKWTRESESLY